MKRLVLPLLLLLCSPVTPAGAAQPVVVTRSTVEVPEAIVAVLDAYAQAWEAGDSHRLAALFASDGMALPNGGLPAQGADAIATAYARSSGGSLHLRPIGYERDGDLAVVIGAFGAGPDREVGKFVLVLRRSADDAWKIVADIDNMNLLPRSPATAVAPGT